MKKPIELTYSEVSKVTNGLFLLYERIVAMNHAVIIDDTSRIIAATNFECEQISQLIAKMEEFREQFQNTNDDENT